MVARAPRSLSLPDVLAALRIRENRAALPSGKTVRDLGEIRQFLSGNAISAPLDLIWAPLLLVALFVMHWAYGSYSVLCVVILCVPGLIGVLMTRHLFEHANYETILSFAQISVALRPAQ